MALPFAITENGYQFDDFNPFSLIDHSFTDEIEGTQITNKKGKRLGKVITNHKNIGVAMVDLTKLDQNDFNGYKLEDQKVVFWQPCWMEDIVIPEMDA